MNFAQYLNTPVVVKKSRMLQESRNFGASEEGKKKIALILTYLAENKTITARAAARLIGLGDTAGRWYLRQMQLAGMLDSKPIGPFHQLVYWSV